MKSFSLLVAAALHPSMAYAFSSIAAQLPSYGTSYAPIVSAASVAPWRVTLDIGRQPLANMPSDWARSGCRMPLVIPTDFTAENKIMPHSETVMFTGPEGAVIRPIIGEGWELSNDDLFW